MRNKKWLLLVAGPLFAIAKTPAPSKRKSVISSLNYIRISEPVPNGSVCIMKSLTL
jgi:hypothetical protein